VYYNNSNHVAKIHEDKERNQSICRSGKKEGVLRGKRSKAGKRGKESADMMRA
jgi:hypothetical protein